MIAIFLFNALFSSTCIQENIYDEQITPQVLHLIMNLDGGKELILNDNSRWLVRPEDWEISKLWLAPFALEITLRSSKGYTHAITNRHSGLTIRVKPAPAEE